MEFVELEKCAFSKFLEKHPLGTFYQTVEMEEIAKMSGWKSYYVGVIRGKKIVAGTRIMARSVHFGKKLFYAPRGLVVDYNDFELVKFFVENLKIYVKKRGGYTIHIDPPFMYRERDIDGELVEGGIDNSQVVDELKSLGFKHMGFTRGYDPRKEVRWVFKLPLAGKTKEEIYNNFHSLPKRMLKKGEHLGVRVRELEKSELSVFKEIMESTSERRNFVGRTLEFYEKMYDLFHENGQIQFMVAEVDLDNTLKILNKDKKEEEDKLINVLSSKKENVIKDTKKQIEDVSKKIEKITAIKKEKGKHLFLSAAMFMIYGNDILYYDSGGYKEYMNFCGQYLIQWEMIQKAIELGKEYYNFYGIKGVFDKDDENYGVYNFKRGFNGVVVEHIGDFYLPVSSYYYIQEFINKIKG